jgi:hypothetical protein
MKNKTPLHFSVNSASRVATLPRPVNTDAGSRPRRASSQRETTAGDSARTVHVNPLVGVNRALLVTAKAQLSSASTKYRERGSSKHACIENQSNRHA